MSLQLAIDDSHLREDTTMLLDYMDEVRDQALQKLTILERAALCNDYKEFIIRYHQEKEEEHASNFDFD